MYRIFPVLLVFAALFGLAQTAFAQEATLFFSPSLQTVQTGSVFTVTIMVNTGGQQVNAVAAPFQYPQDLLDAVSLDTTGSVLDVFAPDNAVGGGRVQFSGGKIPPPFSGLQKLYSVQFLAKSLPGTATVSFTPDAAVLTHPGSENILSLPSSGGAVFQVVAVSEVTPQPPPPSPPPAPPSTGAELEITDIRATQSSEGAVIAWNTNRETRGQVHYGLSSEEEYPFSVVEGIFTISHAFVLSGIDPAQDYSVEIIATDEQGNQAKVEQLALRELFVPESTPPPPDIAPENGDGRERIFLFLLIPLALLLLLGLLLFLRMRAAS